jgi:S-adenosylmethionine synthetase
MDISITTRSPYAPPVEFVERKGVGHPDTISDALAEELSRDLAAGYLKHVGAVQAFNVDKAVLAAGSVDVGFGGGEHLRKARMIIIGKADFRNWGPEMEDVVDSIRVNLGEILPDADLDQSFEIDAWISPSSSDLAQVVSGREGDRAPLANDTSFAVASLPRSPLEDTVHQIERRLNSDEFRSQVPVGRDIKVMGARSDTNHVTVAVPVLARKVNSRAEYDAALAEVRTEVGQIAVAHLGAGVVIAINQADTGDSPYLTLTGSSGEAGDDGQVGRGNRFGGLITPYRPMSLEASCGKNPAAHVGKTYHAVAFDIASRLLSESPATEATVKLLSRIGTPVTEPQVVHIETVGDVPEGQAYEIAAECLADWRGVRDRLISGYYELY